MTRSEGPKAWVVSVDMGYGHQRAAFPLKDIAFERIITANSDRIISPRERRIWKFSRVFYETVSRLRAIPVLGRLTFGLYDKLQHIGPFYPFRVDHHPTLSVLQVKNWIVHRGLCSSLIDYVRKEKLPFIATHFIPALAAEYLGLDEVYCVVTDTDINRVWVSDKPAASKITYLASSRHAVMRLRAYGVPDERIVLTGFPLPKENIGGLGKKTLKQDLADRLPNLDPKRKFLTEERAVILQHLGPRGIKRKSSHPLTLTYMVGGAGALAEIGVQIVASLKDRILKGEMSVNLAAGTRLDVAAYFKKELKLIGIDSETCENVRIRFAIDKRTYFASASEALRTTDILWTKPSELSFYTALGLPIIIAPAVGAQEVFNKEWLIHIGSGFEQEDPRYTNDWLFYVLESGKYAEAAWHGFMEAPCLGTYSIEDVVFHKGQRHNNAKQPDSSGGKGGR